MIEPTECFQFADKCKEVNRQYMLNNNAELDNGVYNENSEEEKDDPAKAGDGAPAPLDNLVGLNMQLENQPEIVI